MGHVWCLLVPEALEEIIWGAVDSICSLQIF